MTTKTNPLAVPLVVQTAPKRIWLQIADDAYSATEAFPDDALDHITWCADSVMDTEVKYVRADLVAELVEADREYDAAAAAYDAALPWTGLGDPEPGLEEDHPVSIRLCAARERRRSALAAFGGEP